MTDFLTDDCSGSFSTNWESNGNSIVNESDFSGGRLRLNHVSSGQAYGCNALCKTTFTASGKVYFAFKWWPIASANMYDDDFTDAFCSFDIVPTSPTYSTSTTEGERGYQAEVLSGDYKIVLYLRSDLSGKISAGEINNGSRLLLIDESFTYDEINGHEILFIVDFDNEWMELHVDDAQIGTQQTISTAVFTGIGANFKVNVHWNNYTKYYPMYFDDFVFSDSIATPKEISDGFGFSDQADGVSTSQAMSEGFGFTDTVNGYTTAGNMADGFGFDDSILAEREAFATIADGLSFNDSSTGEREVLAETADALGFSDAFSAFNWSDWLAANQHRATLRYYLTITGEADETTDVEVPMANFQARKKTDQQTFLQVTIPGATYATQIADRSNGELVVEMAYIVDGEESVREEIIRTGITLIDIHTGSKSTSYVLTGYATQEFVGKVTTLEDSTYRAVTSGKLRHRFAVADPYLVPGDTCRVGDDEFTVDNISYFIAARTASFMEVGE